jgi:pyruvate formate lyase activating enzyme
VEISPGALAAEALEAVREGSIGVAYTYNEPSIWFEYVYDTSRLVREKGLCNVLVTNGFISREPLELLLPYIDAMNIDVKAFTASFYNEICRGALENVLETLEAVAGRCHIEVTTLVIPGLNDSPEEIGRLSEWLAGISPKIPLHLSRFFPNYRMHDRPQTPVETLERARDKALEKLDYVYIGNVW